MRNKHPCKEIEQAIKYAEEQGWRFVKAGKSSHSWGRLLCPEDSRDGCIISLWSTPKNPENHAKQIRNEVDKCPHRRNGENVEE